MISCWFLLAFRCRQASYMEISCDLMLIFLLLLLLLVLLSLRLRAVMNSCWPLGDLLATFVGNHRAITSCCWFCFFSFEIP